MLNGFEAHDCIIVSSVYVLESVASKSLTPWSCYSTQLDDIVERTNICYAFP